MKKFYLLVSTVLITSFSFGQVILRVDRLNGPGPTSILTADDVSGEGLTRGPGAVQAGNDGENEFRTRGLHDSSNESNAIANGDYVQVVVSAVEDYDLTVTRMRFRMYRGNSGPPNFAIYYSYDDFFSVPTKLAQGALTTNATDYIYSNLNLVHPSSGGEITVRIYAWGAGSNGQNGDLRIVGNATWDAVPPFVPGITMSGTSTFDGLVYSGGAWLPNAPNGTTGNLNAIVKDGTTAFTTDVSINNITVNPSANLNIFETGSLIVNGDLTVNGTMTMRSTGTRYSSVIPNGAVTGFDQTSFIYQRHVDISSSVGGNDLISAPLSGADFNTFAGANLNIVDNPTTPTQKLFGPFDKSTGTYLYWDSITEGGEILTPGVGYRSASKNDGTFDFFGDFNTGTITVPLVYGGPKFESWNLVGNPYPSYIRLDGFLAENNSKFNPNCAGVYGYDGNASDGWTIWNLAYLEVNPDAKMTPGQGFLFSVIAGGETCVFLPSMRDIGNTDDFILGKKSKTDYLQLQMSNGTKISSTDFYFSNNASKGMDVGYDAAVFNFKAPSYAIYSQLIEDNSGNDIAIQSIHPDDKSKASIPLGINAAQGSQLTLSISNSTFDNSENIYLEDRLLNTFTLLTDQDYTFTATTKLSGVGRFFLNFQSSTLSVGDKDTDNLIIYHSKESGKIHINGILTGDTKAELFDIQGRSVKKKALDKSASQNLIDVSNLGNGVYILRLISNEISQSKKLIIRN